MRATARGQRPDWQGGSSSVPREPIARRGYHVHSPWINRQRRGGRGGAGAVPARGCGEPGAAGAAVTSHPSPPARAAGPPGAVGSSPSLSHRQAVVAALAVQRAGLMLRGGGGPWWASLPVMVAEGASAGPGTVLRSVSASPRRQLAWPGAVERAKLCCDGVSPGGPHRPPEPVVLRVRGAKGLVCT